MSKKNNMYNSNRLSWCLFMRRGWSWWKNIKDIPIWIKRVFFLLKYGYCPQARWQMDCWCMDVFRELLTWLSNNRHGDAVIIEDYNESEEKSKENHEAYNKVLDKMISLLDYMEDDNPLYENWTYQEKSDSIENAKNEFFELFSKYFFTFWD